MTSATDWARMNNNAAIDWARTHVHTRATPLEPGLYVTRNLDPVLVPATCWERLERALHDLKEATHA